MGRFNFPIRIVFYREDGQLIAHCLDMDIMGHGSTHEEAMRVLVQAIAVQVHEFIETRNLSNLFSSADPEYIEMFARGKNVALGKVEVHFDSMDFTPIEARDYSGEEFEEYSPDACLV